MEPVRCATCGRSFGSIQYFMGHLRANKNIRCHMAFCRRSDHKKKASGDPNHGTAASERQKATAEIEKASLTGSMMDDDLEQKQ